jgi:hypothetical protein
MACHVKPHYFPLAVVSRRMRVVSLDCLGLMTLKDISRKLLAVAALFALLAASTPALAESLSAPNSPACCHTAYCPVHHGQSRDMQKDKSNCETAGHPARTDCSMRACDATPNQAVGTALFTLAAHITISYQATVQAAPLSLSGFAPFVVNLPSTPPPRTLPS